MAARTLCPACEEYMTVKTVVKLNSKVRCPHCYADLVVIQISPLELDWDEDMEDDWDDEDDLEDEEDDDDDDDDDWDK